MLNLATLIYGQIRQATSKATAYLSSQSNREYILGSLIELLRIVIYMVAGWRTLKMTQQN